MFWVERPIAALCLFFVCTAGDGSRSLIRVRVACGGVVAVD